MTRFVLDTNVVVSGMLWGGDPGHLLRRARTGKITLFTSEALLDELTEILERSKFAQQIRASQLTRAELVEGYAGLALLVAPHAVQGVAPDPDDDVVLGTAVAAKADVVSGDRALLALGSYGEVRILSVAEAVRVEAAGGH